jgi:arginine decarboxylase
MCVIRVVRGAATGPTALASYDAALAEANVHDYNLVRVSSVVPADAHVEVVEAAPDLGPAGNRLTVVEARSTLAPGEPGPASAALGWALPREGAGVFYEDGGTDPAATRRTVREGLAAARDLRPGRDWAGGDEALCVSTTGADADRYVTTVALAVYGESEPIC